MAVIFLTDAATIAQAETLPVTTPYVFQFARNLNGPWFANGAEACVDYMAEYNKANNCAAAPASTFCRGTCSADPYPSNHFVWKLPNYFGLGASGLSGDGWFYTRTACPAGYEPKGGAICSLIPSAETFIITFDPKSATIEPGKSTRLTVTVVNQLDHQPPKNPITVNISLKVDAQSGGHVHGDSTRPRGSIDTIKCETDATCKTVTIPAGSSTATFDFNATDAAGTHTVTASCDKCVNRAASVTVDVKVEGLSALSASFDYALVGAVAGRHTDNHYLTATAQANLQSLIDKYNKAYPAGPALHLNDASLVWGGKFDISGKWAGEHAEHRRGVVIDIRANQLASAIPQARFNKFERMAANSGTFADLHCAYSGRYVCPACLPACWIPAPTVITTSAC